MNTSHLAALTAAVITLGTLMPKPAHAQTSPSIPIGSLSAFPTVVMTGTKPTLTWSINYPSVVKDYVTVTPPSTVTPKQNLVCDIRILGAGVTTQNSNGTINYIQTRGFVRYNGSSSWTTIFDGKQTDTVVQQQGILPLFKGISVTTAKAMNFGGQYYWNGAWSTARYSTSGSYIKALVNGDTCPSRVPDYNAPSLESFLKPYLDSSRKVRIGPMDVIIFMELTHTSTDDVGYDEQDLVFLVTYRTP
ncbi:MAG: hypothetical protein NTV46_13785 [Verrucomicrobia bacterium]|nr:hypothetical protein [Verrucomicrobiota bacterium]